MLSETCWCFVLTADSHNMLLPHALKELNNLDLGLPQGEWTTPIPQRPCKGLIIAGGGMDILS